jgi:replication factor C subunit 1
MDEVDGMSAGDRGGVGALNALIKKTKVGRFSASPS